MAGEFETTPDPVEIEGSFNTFMSNARGVKRIANGIKSGLEAGGANMHNILVGYNQIREARISMADLATMPGMGAEAKKHFGNLHAPGAAWTALDNALAAFVADFGAALPVNANGILLTRKLAPDGTPTGATQEESGADAAALVAVCAALLAVFA